MSAPLATPVAFVVVASSEIRVPVEAGRVPARRSVCRTSGLPPASEAGPGTLMPTFDSIVDATPWAAPGRAPNEASPVEATMNPPRIDAPSLALNRPFMTDLLRIVASGPDGGSDRDPIGLHLRIRRGATRGSCTAALVSQLRL